MIKKFTSILLRLPKSKKFKGVKKLKPQKPYKVFDEPRAKVQAQQNIRDQLGGDDFGNWGPQSLSELRGESIAFKLGNRRFFKSIMPEVKKGKTVIASKIKKFDTKSRAGLKAYKTKGKNPKIKSPRQLIIKKNESALKRYDKVDKDVSAFQTKVTERFSGKTKVMPFVTRTKSTKIKRDPREQQMFRQTQSDWGKDPDAFPDTSDMMLGINRTFKTNRGLGTKGKGPFASMKYKRYDWKKKK